MSASRRREGRRPAAPARWPRRLALALVVAALGACAPTVGATAPSTPAADATRTVAEIAYHRMEIGRLQTGAYTTNVLIDLDLPRGARWTVLDFTEDDYVLRFSHDDVTDVVWIVDPGGVQVRGAP